MFEKGFLAEKFIVSAIFESALYKARKRKSLFRTTCGCSQRKTLNDYWKMFSFVSIKGEMHMIDFEKWDTNSGEIENYVTILDWKCQMEDAFLCEYKGIIPNGT